jgi:hypothetical protein
MCFDAYLISVQLSDVLQVIVNKIGTYKPKGREILWCGHNLMLEVANEPENADRIPTTASIEFCWGEIQV